MDKRAILIAEDSEDDAFLLRRAFTKMGLGQNLRFVRDGEEAISYLSGRGDFQDRALHPVPSLVLLDIKMSKVTGFDVLEWMRNSKELSLIVTVMFSSSVEESDVTRSYQLRANSYVQKPASGDMKEFAQLFCSYWMELNVDPETPGVV